MPASDSPTCAVVICAYTEQRWTDIVECVASLRAQTRPPDTVVLVVDHNPDLLARAVDAFPDVHVIENDFARGLSGARNAAIAAISSDIIAFVDDDASAAPEWCERILHRFTDPRVAAVGGLAIPRWDGSAPRWFPPEFHWVVGCSWTGLPDAPSPIRNVIGCNMAFRRAVFTEIGVFRSGVGRIGTTPVGCEETELCVRIHQTGRGAVVMYDPRIVVRHHVTPERARTRYFVRRCWAEGHSKAQISRLVGASDATSSERYYAVHVLPLGVINRIAAALRRGDIGGLARACMIVVGGSVTAAGYVVGGLERGRRSARPDHADAPTLAREAA
jgi:GT2 family glycosyltransferase